MREFERIPGKITRVKEQIRALQEQLLALEVEKEAKNTDLQTLQSGISNARDAISACTANSLVGSRENLSELVLVISALLPEEAGLLLLAKADSVLATDSVVVEEGKKKNNTNS